MDQVKIRASVAACGLRKGAEVTVAETPMVAGAIKNGVFQELERFPAAKPVAGTGLACTEPGCILYLGHDGIDPDVHSDVNGQHWKTGDQDFTPVPDPEGTSAE